MSGKKKREPALALARPDTPPLKIAIVGAAPSSRDLAPFEDETWEIWGCSPSNRGLPRITAWFEIHALADLRSKRWEHWALPYVEWLKAQPRVYMQELNDLVPNAVAFPRDEINAKFAAAGQSQALFLTSSIAWQIALAMHLGAAEISIYGVDMAAASEYDYERPGCKYWIERARAAGISVYVPPQSDLDVAAPQYGFDDASPEAIWFKTRAMELQDRLDSLAAQCAECDNRKAGLLKEHNYISGALEQHNAIRKARVSFSGPDLR
jgi:hypothetical protein